MSDTVLSEPPDRLRRKVLDACPHLSGRAWAALDGGRVNDVWRVGDHVVKAYSAKAASLLFRNDPEAERASLAALGAAGLSPRLVGAGADWIVYRHVDGVPWAGHAPERVGGLLAQVGQGHVAGLPHRAGGSAAILALGRRIAGECRGTMPPVPDDPGLPPPERLSLCHGDPVPANILEQPGGGLMLIDWQCPHLGDAAEDAFVFLSPAMQSLYRGAPLSRQAEAAFIHALPPPVADRLAGLLPLLHWRMAAHCLWKSEAGFAGYADAYRLECAALAVLT